MLRRNRRIVAALLLGALAVYFAIAAFGYFQAVSWRPSPRIAVVLAVLAGIVLVSNAARFWRRPRRPPPPKKRPTHLKIVRNENDTLH